MFNFIKRIQEWNKYRLERENQRQREKTILITRVFIANETSAFRYLRDIGNKIVIVDIDPELKQNGIIEVFNRDKKIEILEKYKVIQPICSKK